MEGGNLKYIPKIFSIDQRQSLDSISLSRLSFANPKEENAESRTAAEERSSSSKTVLPLSLSRPRTPPPQGFLPPRVESRLDFLGKVERVPLWAVHLVALPLHQTNRQPLLGETGIKDNAGFSLPLSFVASYFAQSRSKLCSRFRSRSEWRYSYAPSSIVSSSSSESRKQLAVIYKGTRRRHFLKHRRSRAP